MTLRWIAFGAGWFLAVDLALWHRAIDAIGAGLATVLANTQVVFVGLLAWAVHRERPTRAALLVIPLIFGGVILISGLGLTDAYGDDPTAGAVMGVLGGVAYSGFLLLYRRSNRILAPPAGPMLDSTLGMTVGSLAFGVTDPRFSFGLHFPAHGWLLALAVIAQVVGWLLISIALPRLAALETSVMLLLQPALTVLWGFLLFDERLGLAQWMGAVVVLAGVATLGAVGSVRREPEADRGALS